MSRIVGGEFLLGEKEKEFFVRWMWRLSAFLEIEILDYVVMSNHYHQLVRVPGVIELSDSELLERLKCYYGEESLETMIFEDALQQGEEAVLPLRTHYLKRMGNISEFEKVLKQGFSSWYNRRYNRRGTLWMERGQIQTRGKKGSITRELRLETLQREGHLPIGELLRLRVRYFSDGLVLGSELFVEEVFELNRSRFGEKRKSGARPIRGMPDQSLKVIRDLRLNPVS